PLASVVIRPPLNWLTTFLSYIDIPIATGFGERRNLIIIHTTDVIVAVGGEY
ncbi:MAG: hypothetical protein HRF42_14350, partial [Candidatus Brocadia sp.]